jgi:hypothetical protein
MIKRIIGLIIVVLTVFSCLPDGTQTYIVPTIPEAFYSPWGMAIKCSQSTVNMVVVEFGTTNTKSFTAEGNGTDYDGTALHIVFHGYYDIPTDSLHFSLSTYNQKNNELARTDSCSVLFDQYDGGYINLLNTYMNPEKISCKIAVQFSFSANSISSNTNCCDFDNENYFCLK